jgi:hypothetical protein
MVTIGHFSVFSVSPATPAGSLQRGAHDHDREEPGEQDCSAGSTQER